MTPEARVKAKVKKALDGHYRFMPVQRGFGAPALDFYYCVHGGFVAVETKVPGEKLTLRQQETSRQICEAGGQVYVVRDDTDVAYMLNQLNSPMQIKGLFYDTNPKETDYVGTNEIQSGAHEAR